MYKIFPAILFVMLLGVAHAQQRSGKPANIIFDTDIGPDYDDVGAITLLHAFADNKEAKILATVASNRYEGIAAVLNVFNTYFKRSDILIGVPKGTGPDMRDGQHWTDTILGKYPHQIRTNDEAPDAITVYRKVLTSQPDKSVTIVTVGFLTNLSGLLNSAADNYSPLSGKELVSKKVKLLVSMAGGFPAGREFNVMMDAGASVNVFQNWPTPIIFSGFEIGEKIKTGLPLVNNIKIKNDPAQDVFRICIAKSPEDSTGRKSWDETAVLVAVRGYAPYYYLYPGRIKVETDGKNTWDSDANGQHYLVAATDPKQVQDLIDSLMMHQPGTKIKKLKTARP